MLESLVAFAIGLAIVPCIRLMGWMRAKKHRQKLIDSRKNEFPAIGDCHVQLSVVIESSNQQGAWVRFEDALRSLLDSNFDTMAGSFHRFEKNPVVTYSFIGDGSAHAVKLYDEIALIMKQEKLQYHLLAAQEMGDRHDVFGYRTLKELDCITAW